LPEDGSVPNALTVDSIAAYAKARGETAAAQAIADELEIPVDRLLTGGRLDPRKAAGEAIKLETAQLGPYASLAGDVVATFVEGGHPDWKAIVGDVSAVVGASICLATGVLAPIAPLCGIVGSLLGPLFYEIGKDIAEGLGLYHEPPPAPPAFAVPSLSGAYQQAGLWFFHQTPQYMTRLLALRQITLTVCASAERLRALYAANANENISWLEAYQKLQTFGLTLPNEAFQTMGFEPALDGEQRAGYRAGLYQEVGVEEWYVAHYINRDPVLRETHPFDEPSWWNRPSTLATLRPSLVGKETERKTAFVCSADITLDHYEFGGANTTGTVPSALLWVYDRQSLFLQHESQTPVTPWILTSPLGLAMSARDLPATLARMSRDPTSLSTVVDRDGNILPSWTVNPVVDLQTATLTRTPTPDEDGLASLKHFAETFPTVNPSLAVYFSPNPPPPFDPFSVAPGQPGTWVYSWGPGPPPTSPFTVTIWAASSTYVLTYYGEGYRSLIGRENDFDALKKSYTLSLEVAFARARKDVRRVAKNVRAGRRPDVFTSADQASSFAQSFSASLRQASASLPPATSSSGSGLLKLAALAALGWGAHRAYVRKSWPFHPRHAAAKAKRKATR